MESTEEQDIKYMREAVNEASKAIESGEVPIGCVIVYKDEIIGRGHNLRNSKKNPLCHGGNFRNKRSGRLYGRLAS